MLTFQQVYMGSQQLIPNIYIKQILSRKKRRRRKSKRNRNRNRRKEKKNKEEEEEEENEKNKEVAKTINKFKQKARESYKTEYKFGFGPTLIILLREIASLASRFWEQQNSYFRITPREYESPSDPVRRYVTIGDYLESLLFGDRLQTLYRGGEEALLNIDIWNLPIDVFQSEFQNMQEASKARGGKACILSRGDGLANCAKFGRCGMSYWTSRS
ncbi:unnamed protein product [Blepharisma stoltei]|uniref:Uncharacterized protein n=1 Tax=Blepharisma stoltei TaxID=1481888 RepID=A0AAU9IHV6_9CILI|nr:unnamed protein product [Blepharisma stoltei]